MNCREQANVQTRDQRSNALPHPRPTPANPANSTWWQPPPRAPSSKATTAKIKPAILPPQQEQPDSSQKMTMLRQNKTPTHADCGIATGTTRATNHPSFKEIGPKLTEFELSNRPIPSKSPPTYVHHGTKPQKSPKNQTVTFLCQNRTPIHADCGIASALTRASNQPSFKEIGQKLAENEPSRPPYYDMSTSSAIARSPQNTSRVESYTENWYKNSTIPKS